MRRRDACSRAIEPHPSHLPSQWLRARRIRRTTITDVFSLVQVHFRGR
jgi:hypothetical protein